MAVLPGRNYEVIVLSRWPKGGVPLYQNFKTKLWSFLEKYGCEKGGQKIKRGFPCSRQDSLVTLNILFYYFI